MKLSEMWLREWANPSIPTAELAEQLTMCGLEIESIEPVAGEFSGVVVAQIKKITKHPDADRLNVCEVDAGDQTVQVVCGGKNIYEGMKAPLATVGAALPGDFKIKKSKLRGVESHGMLCAASELGLAEESEGIVDLPVEAAVGTDLREYLQLEDSVLELGITPNRGDCLSIAGLAREVSAINGIGLNKPEFEAVKEACSAKPQVDIQFAKGCPRYAARILKAVNAGAKTPMWMQEKLRRSGIRSISSVVDVTNFVMLELGQPMHAFDYDKVDSGVVVRLAKGGEKITLLDDSEVELNDETLVIADAKQPLAIAGVMGGSESGVTEKTQNILLESAFFDPIAVGKAAKHYGIGSDSSYRFERFVDPTLQEQAIERATTLLLDIVGGEAGPVIVSQGEEFLPKPQQIELRKERLSLMLGFEIAADAVAKILESLQMQVVAHDAGWTVTPPAYRSDIAIEADLVEEVARIYGYEKLPATSPQASFSISPISPLQTMRAKSRNCLVGLGYHEVVSYSFVDEKIQTALGFADNQIQLLNPISADLSVMQTSLIPSLLSTLSHNVHRQQSRARLFEVGMCFAKQNDGVKYHTTVAGILLGAKVPQQWGSGDDKLNFFDAKGDVESLLADIGIVNPVFDRSALSALHPGQSADISIGKQNIGLVGALHPSVLKAVDITEPAFVFEINLSELNVVGDFIFEPLSKYPAITRDLAFVVSDEITSSYAQEVVKEAAGELLVNLQLFDVYHGKGLPEKHKSFAFALTLQDSSRTLVEEDVAGIVDAVITAMKEKCGAQLR